MYVASKSFEKSESNILLRTRNIYINSKIT